MLWLLVTSPGQGGLQAQPSKSPERLGAPSPIALEPTTTSIRLPQGTRLYQAPDAVSGVLALLDEEVELAVREREGSWLRVLYQGMLCWVRPTSPGAPQAHSSEASKAHAHSTGGGNAGDESAVSVAPLSSAYAPSEGQPPEAVLQLLTERRSFQAGPFTLITDSQDDRLIRRLQAVAEHLVEFYDSRYSLELQDRVYGTVVLYSTPGQYQRLIAGDPRLERLGGEGHASGRHAVLYAGNRTDLEVRILYLHELSHLLNRLALGNAVPLWIEEGIANDVAFSEIDREGRPLASTLVSNTVGTVRGRNGGFRNQVAGPVASLIRLANLSLKGGLPPVEELVELTAPEFIAEQGRELRYLQSAFLVRFLMSRQGARETFLEQLQSVARDDGFDSEALVAPFGSYKKLQKRFEQWLRNEVAGAI